MITQNYCMVCATRLLICHFVYQTVTFPTAPFLYKDTTPGSGCQYLANAKRGYFIYFNTNDKKRQKKTSCLSLFVDGG